ncbi:hypothetical protein L484_002600 [Morus notabilis]|uniref:Uncharacterized protein n=1 Tax=Morus notabilis TaxID=981085 RepID=W9RKC1_9ROSA|nr:hypothetical protein L484_002600 [Morus notabilis]
MVAVVAELLGEYTAALARATERLLPPPRSLRFSFHSGRTSRAISIFSAQDSSSFILYF